MTDGRSNASSIDDADAGPRERIIAAGVKLVAERGAEGATTRAIASEASVQPPTIFRHFGDKDGLLDSVAERMMVDFIEQKRQQADSGDPVEDLRTGMEAFMAFGIGNPDIFLHMYGRPGRLPAAASLGQDTLRGRIHEAALTGRMAVSEQRAFDIIHGLERGTVMSMLERDKGDRHGMIASAGDAALAILTGELLLPDAGPRSAAALLRAHIHDLKTLSPGERLLLSELLARIADDRTAAAGDVDRSGPN